MISEKASNATSLVGYGLTTIGEVCEEVSQAGPSNDFVYLDIGSVDREAKAFSHLKTISSGDAPSRARQVVRPDDVLVSMTRPNLNAVAMVPNLSGEVIASTGFHVLRSAWVEPKFLYRLVQTEAFIQAMTAVVQGALYPAVRPKDIASFPLNLPPRAEQTRIVEKLEALFSDLDAGVAELKFAQSKIERYRQSLLKAAVAGVLTADWRASNGKLQESGAEFLQGILSKRRARWEQKQLIKFSEQGKVPQGSWQGKYAEPAAPNLTDLPLLPPGWTWATVDQLSFVVRGASPRPAGDPRYFGGHIPWITVGALTADEGMYLDHVDQFVTPQGRDASRYIEADTLLLTNSGATLGVPKITRIGGCINDGSVALLDIDAPVKSYLYWFLRTQTRRLRALNQGAAQPNLNTDIVRKICVPLCPRDEMVLINELLEKSIQSMFIQASAVEHGLRQAAAQRGNLLKAAFFGQLVPQDPSEEPASELLARIRANHVSKGNGAPRRRRKTA